MTSGNLIIFLALLIFIVPLSLLGAVIAGVIVVQNWRPIIYMAAALTTMALIAMAYHALLSPPV